MGKKIQQIWVSWGDEKLTLVGKLGYYSDSEIGLQYDSQGRISQLFGRLGYYSDNVFSFEYQDDIMVAMRGQLGYYADSVFTFGYDKSGKNIIQMNGQIGYFGDNVFTFGYYEPEKLSVIN